MRNPLYLAVVLAVLSASGETVAQSDIALATRTANLQALSEKLKKRDENDRQQAQTWAAHSGIPLRRELPNGKVLELQRVTPGVGPTFYITNNISAADTVSTDEVWPGGTAGLLLDGGGMTVGEWDAGAVYAGHPDLSDRLTQVDGATTISNHSTHVAGTLIASGDGIRTDTRGMAYAALLNAYDWNSDTAEMALAASNGLLVSNHSYGIAAGWINIGGAPPDGWWWIGGSGNSEDSNFGYYDAETQLWDQIAFDAPYYLIVKAAGNDRWDTGPDTGELYTIVDQDGTPLSTSTSPKPADCTPAGYDCLPTTSVAKNILTVGAVDDIPGGYSPLAGPSSVLMTGFSGWGPTDDGRIKPDVVGNGWLLLSTWGEDPYYAWQLGTSMAAPNVSGSLLLLQEHYQDIHGTGNFMRAATLKAVAIHSADESGDADGPDYEFGWGLLNTKAAARLISEDGGGVHQIVEGTLSDGGTDIVQINVGDPDAIVTATLVWMDPPGTPVAPVLDPTATMLVNDLDLRIEIGGSTYSPWVLNPASPSAAASTGDNVRDNVEQVVVNAGGSGSYAIEVSHKGTLLNGQSQDYSLIISVAPPAPMSSGFLIDEDFSQGLPAGWSVQTSRGIAWTINTPVPGDPRYNNDTGGSGNFAMVDNYDEVNDKYSNTLTSLRTPILDLSSTQAATLSFNSFFWYDYFESINVDVSTNGGTGWTNVWTHSGFSNMPAHYTLDLSGALAGQASVMLRFRFQSSILGSDGDRWKIDNVQLEVFGGTPLPPPPDSDPPGQASNPSPDSSGNEVDLSATLSWSAGVLTTSHNVYFGTDSTPDSGELQGNQTGTSFDPGTLAYSTTYYWRVDESNSDGTTQGVTWSFTTGPEPVGNPPGLATNPSPVTGGDSVVPDTLLTWSAGSLATSRDVYFGTDSTPDAGEIQGNQTGTSFNPSALTYSTTYYWRIDEVNGDGTTQGTTWSFTTEAAPPETMNLASLTGSMIPESRGRWTAEVEISVEDQGNNPESGVTVEGNWSNGTNGSVSCVTIGDSCTVQKTRLKNQVTSVTFTINNLTKDGLTYSPADDVGGSSIAVYQNSADKTPGATNDSYQTIVNTPVSGSVINNDNQGDGPASISNNTSPSSGSLSLGNDGVFTYTPNPGFDDSDSFTYSITDQDGDVSNTATVSITITADEPPPPSGDPSVSASPYKVKGIQHVELSWLNFSGTDVDISRDGKALEGSPISNDGSHVDNIGAKGGGSYTYQVCETDPDTSNCKSASATF
jgi:hypothetical protein